MSEAETLKETEVEFSGNDHQPDENEVSESNEVCDIEQCKVIRLPLSRVKKIIKMDPDVHLASQDAVFLIAKAAELFLDSLSKEAYSYTAAENKKTISRKHIESAISSIDALAFLDGALDWS